ncbi:hypothetical protein [Mitsuokella multacida]|uniref:hypothetical protein n=1 Tax=Mitsuokella multacida TaxID=52226 RepID=UPI002664FA9E|nr:hypothetical protein [Mitsuokella multacida]
MRTQEEIKATHEKAERLKKKLAAMGIHSDAELDEAIKNTKLDISLFVTPMPDVETKEVIA